MARTYRRCECGCGEVTQSRFAPGHDAKLKSRLMKAAANGDQDALDELERRGWVGGDNRKFGVEIEFTWATDESRDGMAGLLMAAMRNVGLGSHWTMAYCGNRVSGTWNICTDSSVGNGKGLELVSPPLSGKAGLDALRRACEALNSIGARVDRTCGLHVHHDAHDLTLATARNLVRIYTGSQAAINSVLAPSRRDNHYCAAWGPTEVDGLGQYNTMSDIAGLFSRYKTVNLCSYPKHGTVEFRQHQGTTEFSKIAAWIALGQALIKAAKANRRVQADNIRDLVQGLKLRADHVEYFTTRAASFAARA